MATNDQYRVKKDTSSRKNTTEQPNVHDLVEAAAIQGMKEAYIKVLKSGYDEQIQAMKAEHAKQIEAMDTEYAKQITQLKKDYEKAMEGAKHQVRTDAIVANLSKQKANLQSTLDEALAANKAAN